MSDTVLVARCPEHGLHGQRDTCFDCGGPVEQIPMVRVSAGAVLIETTIPGEPRTKKRPRVLRSGRTYTPKETQEAEEAIRWHLRSIGARPDSDHFLRVEIEFRNSTNHRRDIDNLLKLVLDAGNGFAWGDDWQIVELEVRVERGRASPGTDLRVIALRPIKGETLFPH